MLKSEITKIVRRKQFLIIVNVLMISVMLDFVVTCIQYYGIELSWIRSAYDSTILHNSVPLFTKQLYTTLFPLIASIIASDVYCMEQQLGISSFIETRTSKSRNRKMKIISVGLVSFLIIFIPLMLNFLLTLTAFPIQAHYSSNVTYLTLSEPQEGRILGYLDQFYPYLNIFCFILIRSLIGMSMAIFALALSFLNRLNRYLILFSPMIFYTLYVSATQLSQSEFIRTSIFGINTYGSIWAIWLYIFINLLLSFIFTIIGNREG